MNKRIFWFLSMLLMLFVTTNIGITPAWADTYGNFAKLAAHNKVNVDYKIIANNVGSSTVVIAIHGGNIESETTQLAAAVAKQGNYNFYSFEGLKPNSASLHITATRNDEPILCSMVGKSTRTLSIHGCKGTNQALTNLGGLDKNLCQKIRAELVSAGFKVVPAPASIGGTKPANICNRDRTHEGVQLELSVPLRNQLAQNTSEFNRYVDALLAALK